MIAQTQALMANISLADLVRTFDQFLQSEIDQYSHGANAKWDLQYDDSGRQILLLTIRNSFGFASDRFAPDELKDDKSIVARLQRLIIDLTQSSRRASIAIQETKVTAQQLEALRMAMNSDQTFLSGKPRLLNQVRFNADGSFTVRDFAIEVNEGMINAAKQVIRRSGLTPKEEPLAQKPGVQQAVHALVDAHRRDPASPPRLVLWFRLDDPRDIHLLEIADDVADLGDGALGGVALGAGGAIPGARAIVIYLAAPSEVHKAFEVNPGHPAIEAMLNRSGEVVLPAGDWQALVAEFPEMNQQPAV